MWVRKKKSKWGRKEVKEKSKPSLGFQSSGICLYASCNNLPTGLLGCELMSGVGGRKKYIYIPPSLLKLPSSLFGSSRVEFPSNGISTPLFVLNFGPLCTCPFAAPRLSLIARLNPPSFFLTINFWFNQFGTSDLKSNNNAVFYYS